MSQPEQKLTTPVSLVVDAVLVIAFTLYMYSVCKTHVPSRDPNMILLWGGLTAALFGALGWLTLQMFRVVYRFQREERAAAQKQR